MGNNYISVINKNESSIILVNAILFVSFCRQFPNMFLSKTNKRGKGRFSSSPRSVPVKNLDLQINVMSGPTNRTPTGSKELELAQTGLGKRMVSVPEDSSHKEVLI